MFANRGPIPPLTPDQRAHSDRLYYEYIARPEHRDRLTVPLRASLRAAANRIARCGPPPSYNQRLGYRSWKKRRARAAAIAEYGPTDR